MTKSKNVLLISGAVVLWIAVMISIMIYSGAIVFDHSAVLETDTRSTLAWEGHKYVRCDGIYDVAKRVAMTTDGVGVYAIKGDPGHNFVYVADGSLYFPNHLYVREDYDIPDSGEVTEVFFDNTPVAEDELCDVMEKIISSAKTNDNKIKDNFWAIGDRYDDKMVKLSLRYGDSPVACMEGYIGRVNGVWVFTADDIYKDSYGGIPYTAHCYRIPEEFQPLLKECFSEYL